MSRLVVHKWYDEIYDVHYILLLGSFQDADKWSRRVRKAPLPDGALVARGQGACFQRLDEKRSTVILWLSGTGKSAASRLAILAHECLHATAYVFHHRGLPGMTPDIDEAYAYYLEWLIWTILSVEPHI